MADSPLGTPPSSQPRNSRSMEIAGAAIIGLCVLIGLFSLFSGTEVRIPTVLWLALLGLWLAAVLSPAWGSSSPKLPRLLFGCAVGLSWALTLTLFSGGMVEMILVVTVTLGVYVVRMRTIAAVILANTAVIVAGGFLNDVDRGGLLFVGVFYLVLQVATVLSTTALAREAAMRAELEEKNVELTAASVLLEDSARATERLRISRELHDLIGHQLTVLTLELEAARHRHEPQSPAAPHISRAGQVAKELLRDVRTTVGELRSHGGLDIARALERIAHSVPHLPVHVRVEVDTEVSEAGAQALVRAAQEAVTNTLKHSDASRMDISVAATEDGLVLSVADDGTGPGAFVEGNGVRGIRERFELLGGSVTVDSDRGFTIIAHLPAEETPA